jgi:hypothetical protein
MICKQHAISQPHIQVLVNISFLPFIIGIIRKLISEVVTGKIKLIENVELYHSNQGYFKLSLI